MNCQNGHRSMFKGLSLYLIPFKCFAKTSNFQSKFATTNSNLKKNIFRHALLYHVHVYTFPANWG